VAILFQTNGIALGDGSGSGGAPTQAQVNAAIAGNPQIATDAEVALLLGTKADQTAHDALVANNATQGELDAVELKIDDHIANHPDVKLQSVSRNPDNSLVLTMSDTSVIVVGAATAVVTTETDPVYLADKPNIALKSELHDGTAQDAEIALKADDADLVAETARATAAEATKESLLPTGLGQQYLRRNAADDGWDLVDIEINSSNTLSGPGAPAASIGEDDFYYQQLDAAKGVNDIWGPKAAGAWPAQADFKSADPEELTQAQAISATGPDYTAQGIVSAERLDQWGRSRRVRRVFNVSAPFDFNALNYADRTAVYIRNTNSSSGIAITYGAGGANTLNLTNAAGASGSVPGADSFTLQPLEILAIEKDGVDVHASVFPAERIRYFDDYGEANSAAPVAHDALVVIRATEEMFARKTTLDGIPFPVDGQPNDHWFKIPGGISVRYPGDTGAQLADFDNVYYLDEAVGAVPTAALGKEYTTSVIQANVSDTEAVKNAAKAVVSHYRAVDTGSGPVWIETRTPTNDILLNQYIRQEDIAAAGGEWVDIGGGLEIRAGGDNNVVNFPRLRASDNVEKMIHIEDWYQVNATSEPTGYETRIERLAVGEEWNLRETTVHNLNAGYVHFSLISDVRTGREWLVTYTVQAGDASILLSYTYRGGDIFAVPDATTVRDTVAITANGGAVNVLGGALAHTGTPNGVTVEVPAGQQLLDVTADSGATASIRDRPTGLVEVSVPVGTTGTIDLTCTFQPVTAYSQANTGGIGTTLGTLADIGFVMQDGDEILLRTDLGVIVALWDGTNALGSVRRNDGVQNTVIFTQSGTVLRMQGQTNSGSRRWLKVVR